MTLLLAAALARLGQIGEARVLTRTTLADLPLPFRTAASLRRTYYQLPPEAWASFEAALATGGMPP